MRSVRYIYSVRTITETFFIPAAPLSTNGVELSIITRIYRRPMHIYINTRQLEANYPHHLHEVNKQQGRVND
jgi:hypothetical protein